MTKQTVSKPHPGGQPRSAAVGPEPKRQKRLTATTARNKGGRSPQSRAVVLRQQTSTNAPLSEEAIVLKLGQLCKDAHRTEDELLRIYIDQGNHLMAAADFIRAAGGITRWLANHGLRLGINGKSHTVADNVVLLAKAGYNKCKDAIAWTARNRERVNTNRLSGLGYFVVAIRAFGNRDHLPSIGTPIRLKKRDREGVLLAKLALRDDWLFRLIADLQQACDAGWNPRVLNAIRIEMDHDAATPKTDP